MKCTLLSEFLDRRDRFHNARIEKKCKFSVIFYFHESVIIGKGKHYYTVSCISCLWNSAQTDGCLISSKFIKPSSIYNSFTYKKKGINNSVGSCLYWKLPFFVLGYVPSGQMLSKGFFGAKGLSDIYRKSEHEDDMEKMALYSPFFLSDNRPECEENKHTHLLEMMQGICTQLMPVRNKSWTTYRAMVISFRAVTSGPEASQQPCLSSVPSGFLIHSDPMLPYFHA